MGRKEGKQEPSPVEREGREKIERGEEEADISGEVQPCGAAADGKNAVKDAGERTAGGGEDIPSPAIAAVVADAEPCRLNVDTPDSKAQCLHRRNVAELMDKNGDEQRGKTLCPHEEIEQCRREQCPRADVKKSFLFQVSGFSKIGDGR